MQTTNCKDSESRMSERQIQFLFAEFIHLSIVLSYHIRWRDKVVYNVSWICRERTAETANHGRRNNRSETARCQFAAYSTVSRTVGDTLRQTRTPLGLSMAVARSCYTQLCLSVCLSLCLSVTLTMSPKRASRTTTAGAQSRAMDRLIY